MKSIDHARRAGLLSAMQPVRRLFMFHLAIALVTVAFITSAAARPFSTENRGIGDNSVARLLVQDQPLPQQRLVTLKGRVVDGVSGEPIAKVRIVLPGSSQSTTTDERGAFTLVDLRPGDLELYITTVGYGLVKRTIVVKEGNDAETVIALNQEAATVTEHVTVTPEPFQVTETNAPSEQMLNKTELQDLSKVVIADPLRAVQALPGVSANDDLRSEFAVRGADYRRTGVFLDGILTDGFVHFINAEERVTLSVINTDTIGAVSLLSGAFPAKYGDSTAAVVNLETRDGNRVKPAFRFSTGLQLGTSGVVDGPLADRRGSWLIAGRSSLLDYVSRLIDKATEDSNNGETGSANFSDVGGKLIYDFSARHRIGFSGLFGALKLAESSTAPTDPNEIFKSRSRNTLLTAFWNYTPSSRLFAQTRVFGMHTNLRNTNRTGLIITNEPRTQFGLRNDINFLARPDHRIEGGVYVRSVRAQKTSNFFFTIPPGVTLNFEQFDRRTLEQGYYLQDTYINKDLGLSLTGGARVDHNGLTGETLLSPRAALALTFGAGWTIRAGAGRYSQFPDFPYLFGQLGNSNLNAERATHYNLSVERTFGDRYRALVEVYDREDSGLLFSLSEPRLAGNTIVFGPSPFRNSLRGHARGIELTFQRRSANRLSGWLSYSHAQTRLNHSPSGLNFVSDVDQRHTVSSYGSYRFTGTFNVSGQWRYGSGFPIPGFFRSQGSDLFLASERNLVRLPAYSRLDLRANKAFLFEKWKLTLSGELINVLNHKNLRVPIIEGIDLTGRVYHRFGETLRILPAVGIAIEF